MTSRLAALVLDGNSRAALVAVRSLARAGRPVGALESGDANQPVCFASRWPRTREALPSHALGPLPFLDAVVAVLKRQPADVLLAVSDATVSTLQAGRAHLEPHTRIALASAEAVAKAVDKDRTLAAAEEIGVPVPRGLRVDDMSQTGQAAALTGFPAVVKPATSWAAESYHVGRLQCRVVLEHAELETSVEAILRAGAPAIVQQWASGRREAVHVLYASGRAYAAVGVATSRTYPALGGNSVLRETIPLPADTASAALRLVEHLGLEGYSEVEFRRDAGGRPLLMEVNPRLSAAVEVAVRAGVDFPNLIYDWATGRPLTPVTGYRTGVRVRWLGGDLRWIRETMLRQGQPDVLPLSRAMAVFGGDFLRRTSYDYVDRGDLRPAAVAAAGMVREVAGRRLARRSNGKDNAS
jgi:predicted ATP-grasp superfamily ATP-dependent carboligase